IPVGGDWAAVLEQSVRRSDAMLTVIGPDWLTAPAVNGTRRLDNPNDYVRREIETALGAGKPVIPLVVDDARLPTASDLPPCVRELSFRSGMGIRRGAMDFQSAVADLITALERVTKERLNPSSGGSR